MKENGLNSIIEDINTYNEVFGIDAYTVEDGRRLVKVLRDKSGRRTLKELGIDSYSHGDFVFQTNDIGFEDVIISRRHKPQKHRALEKLDVNNAFEKLIIDNRKSKLLNMMKALG